MYNSVYVRKSIHVHLVIQSMSTILQLLCHHSYTIIFFCTICPPKISGFSNFLLREKVRCELQCSMQAQQHEFSHQERGFVGLRGFGLNYQPNDQRGTRNGRFKLVNQRIFSTHLHRLLSWS